MNEEHPLWRRALTNKDHPLHKMAWLLFDPHFDVIFAATRLENQQDQVVEFAKVLLDEDELYLEMAVGKGLVPGNVVRLMAEWQLTEFIPRVVAMLRETEVHDALYSSLTMALIDFGAASVDPLLELVAEVAAEDDDLARRIGTILSEADKGNVRVMNLLKQQFQSRHTDEFAYQIIAENLMICDPLMGRTFLEDCLQKSIFRPHHKMIRQVLKDAQEGKL